MLWPVCGLHLRVFYDLVLQGLVEFYRAFWSLQGVKGLGFRVGGVGLGLGVVKYSALRTHF